MEVGELSKIIGAQGEANEAAEKQKTSLLGSMAAGAAIGAVLIGTAMALKAVFTGGLSIFKDYAAVGTSAALGAKVGAGLGLVGGGIYSSMAPTELAGGGVIVGEEGVETVIPGTPAGGAKVDNRGIEKRLDYQTERLEFLFARLGTKVDGIALSG